MLLSVKHPSFGIRPPGAPTSIRPPRSAHGSGSSLFRRPGRAMPRPDRTTPASEPPLAEPVPAPEPLRRPTSGPAPAEAPPARRPQRRPTSGPAPAETPPARRPQRRPDRAEKKPQDFDWGPAILATSVTLIIVGLILVGSLDNDRQGNTARRARPTRAASAPRFSASSRAATPTPSDTEDSPWKRAWSVDLELDDNAITNTYVNSDHLVVYDQANKEQRLRGYGLTDGRPRELWSITLEGQPEAITSTVLVTSRSLIDLATGEATDAPWDRLSEPVLVTEDFIMTCAKKDSAVTCAGWDLAGKTLTQRWGPVAVPGDDFLLLNQHAITGDTRTGYALARTRSSAASEPSVYFVSLADGSIRTTRPKEKDGKDLDFVPAADGWLQIEADRKSVTALDPDGTERETYTASRKTSMLLLTDSGLPTLDQYRSAFTSGDTSWASVALDCQSQGRTCTLNGRTLTGTDGNLRVSLMYEGEFTATTSERYLILSQGPRSGQVRIIDREQMSVGPRGYSLFGSRAHVAVARADLLVAVENGILVGYAPTG